MPVKTSVVFGIYPDFAALRASVDTLRGCGFRNNDISVLFPERAVARTLIPPSDPEILAPATEQSEPFIGGPLVGLTYLKPLSTGLVSAALESLGVSSPEAKSYEGHIRSGALLVCVRSSASRWIESAKEILERTGAAEISYSIESVMYDPAGPVPANVAQKSKRETTLRSGD